MLSILQSGWLDTEYEMPFCEMGQRRRKSGREGADCQAQAGLTSFCKANKKKQNKNQAALKNIGAYQQRGRAKTEEDRNQSARGPECRLWLLAAGGESCGKAQRLGKEDCLS